MTVLLGNGEGHRGGFEEDSAKEGGKTYKTIMKEIDWVGDEDR